MIVDRAARTIRHHGLVRDLPGTCYALRDCLVLNDTARGSRPDSWVGRANTGVQMGRIVSRSDKHWKLAAVKPVPGQTSGPGTD